MGKKYLLLTIMLMIILSTMAYGYTLEEMKALKSQKEQSSFRNDISEAEKAAKNWEFSTAEEYLKSAEDVADSEGQKKKVKEVKGILEKERNAYTAKKEREEAERQRVAEVERQKAEQSKQASASSNQSTPSGKNIDWVIVEVDRVTGLFGGSSYAESFSISGGPGTIGNLKKYGASIFKGYNGKIAGTYSWSAYYKDKSDGRNSYSGTVKISGTKQWVRIVINGSSITVFEN